MGFCFGGVFCTILSLSHFFLNFASPFLFFLNLDDFILSSFKKINHLISLPSVLFLFSKLFSWAGHSSPSGPLSLQRKVKRLTKHNKCLQLRILTMPWALRTGQRPKHSWRDSGIGQYHRKITVSENDTRKIYTIELRG